MTPDTYTLETLYLKRWREYRRQVTDTFARPLSFHEWLLRQLWYAECSETDHRAALAAVLAEREKAS